MRKVIRVVAVALAAGVQLAAPARSAPAAAPAAPPAICKALSDEVLSSEWKLSEIPVGSIGDNSAPRETMRAAQTTAELQAIALAFEQMRENRCGSYPYPVLRHSFSEGAYGCSKAISDAATASVVNKQPVDRAAVHAACDREKWVRQAN